MLDELLHQAKLTPEWLHEFVVQSNELDQHEPCSPGEPAYDLHQAAVVLAINRAAQDRYAMPREIHEVLTGGDERATQLRTDTISIGHLHVAKPEMIPKMYWAWTKSMARVIDELRTDDEELIDADRYRNVIFGLHCELMHVRPYNTHNGMMGRILMVNHALLTDIRPWIIPANTREEYFAAIREHSSYVLTELPTEVSVVSSELPSKALRIRGQPQIR